MATLKSKDTTYTAHRAYLQARCERETTRRKRSSFCSIRQILKDGFGYLGKT